MSESNLEMTEAINGNVKQTNAIANGGLKVLGAASGLEMSITVNQTTAVIQDIAAGGTGGGGGSASIDLSFVTATAADILSGKVGADASGNPVNGAIKTVTASLSGNVVTVPAGFIAKDQTLTVPKAGAETVSGNKVTIPVGYIDNQRTITVGTAKGAESITPGTGDKTIASGTYLTGALTVKGDANLKAENIAEGKSIFGVAGSFKGGAEFYKCASVDTGEGEEYIEVSGAGSSDCNGKYYLTNLKSNYASIVYKHESREWYCYYYDGCWGINSSYDMEYYNGFYCTYVDDVTGPWNDCMGAMPSPTVTKKRLPGTGVKSWTGHKAVLIDGEYQFEETETTGLTFSLIVPVVGKVYTADTLVTVDYIYAGMPVPYVDWAMNSYVGTVNGESWNFMQGFHGNHEFSPDGVTFSGDGYVNLDGLTTDLLQGDFTIALEVNQTGTSRTAYFAANDDLYIGIDDNQNTYNMWAGNGGWNILQADNSWDDSSGMGSIKREYNKDVKLVYVHEGTIWKLYVNGALSVEKNRSGSIGTGNTLRLAAWGGGSFKFVGKMRNFKLFREALPEVLIKQL